MTQNQIAFYNYLESKRANLAREGENTRSNVARETETNRHNVVTEEQAGKQLIEMGRHNLATESETRRANLEKELLTGRDQDLRHEIQLDQNVLTGLRDQTQAQLTERGQNVTREKTFYDFLGRLASTVGGIFS